MAKEKPFPTEAALCAAFLDWIDPEIWTAYPECNGWDILLVRREDGFQIGVEAKLRMCVEVVNQALEEYGGGYTATRPGPDCRAVLVPSCASFGIICRYLGVQIIQPYAMPEQWGKRKGKYRFMPELPKRADSHTGDDWQEWCPAERHKLPAYVPDVTAGAKAPVQLTDWKIKAIKLAILLEKRGAVARSDFKHLRMDHRRWLDGAWLQPAAGGFVAGPRFPDLRGQHPRVYGEIAADYPRWKPKEEGSLL